MQLFHLTRIPAIILATGAMSSGLVAQEHNPADEPLQVNHQHAEHGQDGHDHSVVKHGPNGGTVQMVGNQQIETVIKPKGIMFTLIDDAGRVVARPNASGSIKLRVGEAKEECAYELKPLDNNAIGVPVDLSKVSGRMLHIDVMLRGVAAQPVSFHAMGKVSDGTLSDAVLISLQATCPISGKKLGSMGQPPEVIADGKPLFVCCAGCRDQVKSSPQQYIDKYYGAQGEQVRPGVFKSTLADVSAIAAQKICPVMDEPLGGMGAPLKVDVNGKAVYICCAGCAKKLHAQPDAFLSKLAKMGVTPPAIK